MQGGQCGCFWNGGTGGSGGERDITTRSLNGGCRVLRGSRGSGGLGSSVIHLGHHVGGVRLVDSGALCGHFDGRASCCLRRVLRSVVGTDGTIVKGFGVCSEERRILYGSSGGLFGGIAGDGGGTTVHWGEFGQHTTPTLGKRKSDVCGYLSRVSIWGRVGKPGQQYEVVK